MIKRLVILFAAFCMLAFATVAYADVIWTNDFYNKNIDKIERLTHNRFYANGPDGSITFWEAPSTDVFKSVIIRTYANGTVFTLDGIYIHNG